MGISYSVYWWTEKRIHKFYIAHPLSGMAGTHPIGVKSALLCICCNTVHLLEISYSPHCDFDVFEFVFDFLVCVRSPYKHTLVVVNDDSSVF